MAWGATILKQVSISELAGRLLTLRLCLQAVTIAAALLLFPSMGFGRDCSDVEPSATLAIDEGITIGEPGDCYVKWYSGTRGLIGQQEDERKCNSFEGVQVLQFNPDRGSNYNTCRFRIVDSSSERLPLESEADDDSSTIDQDAPVTCRYVNDGVCDEIDGLCAPGTDAVDCESRSPAQKMKDLFEADKLPCPLGSTLCPDGQCYDIDNKTACCEVGYGACDRGESCWHSVGNLCCKTGHLATPQGCVAPSGDISTKRQSENYSPFTIINFCNNSSRTLSLAIGAKVEPLDEYFTFEGWWNIDPGECRALRRVKGWIYYHATNGHGSWGRDKSFCVRNHKFTYVRDGIGSCTEKTAKFTEKRVIDDSHEIGFGD